jgi:hypothetical protein
VYGDEDKCDLLNKYFSLISKLEEENVPLPDFDIKTNNVINEICVTIQLFPLFDLISIFIIFQYVFGLEFSKKM